jgi:AcrR family transcriptional regulator
MDLDQPGRARQHRFDLEDVLSKALAMFLELGFLGSSISQLTEAMGIARPSLYQAFGNKEGLFRAAMKLHHHRRLNCVLSALKKPQFPLVIEHLIKATQQKSPSRPHARRSANLHWAGHRQSCARLSPVSRISMV